MPRSIEQLLHRVTRQRGRQGERLVGVALDGLIEERYIITYWLSSWVQDREGTDAFVMCNDGNEYPLSVRSSLTGCRDSYAHHPEIPCVVVYSGDTAEVVQEKLITLFHLEPRE